MYRSGLVPRRMAMIGLIGGPLAFATASALLFGASEQTSGTNFLFIFTIPEILWEASLGIYLIVKGFKPSHPRLKRWDPRQLGQQTGRIFVVTGANTLFSGQRQVIEDVLVDRAGALRGLAAGELDVAIVFEHAFEPDPAPPDIELVPLFDDPLCVLVPTKHPLATRRSVQVAHLREETWIRAHHGSAARLTDHVLNRARLTPVIIHAGHGDEPVEAQAFVAAGHGITLAHRLNVLLNPDQVTALALAGDAPARHIQLAIMRNQRAPAVRAVIDTLREIGGRRARVAVP